MIRLLTTQLFYDAEQQTLRIAEARIPADNHELRDRAQINTNLATDRDLLLRWIESGVSDLHVFYRDKLVNPATGEGWWTGWGDYNANTSGAQSSGDTATHDDALNTAISHWDFTLGTPADEKALAMLFHRFILRYILWQWGLMFGLSDIASAAKAECDAIKEAINNAVYDIPLPKKYLYHNNPKNEPRISDYYVEYPETSTP